MRIQLEAIMSHDLAALLLSLPNLPVADTSGTIRLAKVTIFENPGQIDTFDYNGKGDTLVLPFKIGEQYIEII